MKLDEIDIRIGMTHEELIQIVEQTEDLLLDRLPAFCFNNYMVIKSILTDEKMYIGLDEEREIISVITYDFRATVDANKAEQMIDELTKLG